MSSVERALKNGVSVSPVDQAAAVTEQKPAPVSQPVKAEEPADLPTDEPITENEAKTQEPPVSEPPVENPPVSPAQPEPEPTKQPTAADSSTQTEFMQWGEFMDVLHKEDIALFGVLNGSRGFIRGDIFLIDSHNSTVGEFIKVSTHSRAIKKALYEVTGKKYRLGIFKGTETQSNVKRDPLEDLISQAQGNINIDLK